MYKKIMYSRFSIKKNKKCGLVHVYPLPSQKEINRLYKGDYYKNYSNYSSQKLVHQRYFRKKLIEIKKKIQAGRILDMGCALGFFLEEARNLGFEVQGSDISSYAVSYCKKKGFEATTDLTQLIKNNKRFDVITAFEVIEHERDPEKMIEIIYKLLKNKGFCLCTTPNYDTLSRRIMGKFWFGYNHREHLYFFSPKILRLLFEKAGFINILVKKDDSRNYPLNYFFKRAADYFKNRSLKKCFLFLAEIFKKSDITFPFNFWGNIIIYAEKP